jgi:hypothetical protein
VQALGLVRGSQGLPTPSHRECAHETNSAAEMQLREPGDAVVLVVLAAAPFAVILILFLIALLRCDRADIPKVMEALAAVLKALRRWRKD